MRLTKRLAIAAIAVSVFATHSASAEMDVGITPTMKKFDGTISGQRVTIMRNQDQKNVVNPAFAKTSRKCPPFCIQPLALPDGVE